jgi:choline dehydrogenase-like flavoprotein
VAEAYDAVVVGSGATGSWAAKELAEGGLNVAVLEAGPLFPLDMDQLAVDDAALRERQPIQSTCAALNTFTSHLFVDDLDNPYSVPEDKPFHWIRSRQVGGRLHVWGLLALRMSDHEFKSAGRDGIGIDWPITYAELAPHYDHVERYLGVTGAKEGLPQVPDGEFLAPAPLTPGEEKLKSAIERRWDTRRLTNSRLARRSPDAMLTDALRTGRLTLLPNAVVSHVVMDSTTRKARGVAYVDGSSKTTREVECRVVVLCASGIESTRILLNSATSEFPDGLANSSGALGHYLMDHALGVDVKGRAPQLLARLRRGHQASRGAYIPAFRNVTEHDVDFARGYGVELEVHPPGGPEGSRFWMSAFCEVLPTRENRVSLDLEKVDAWGIPVARIECAYGENERRMALDALENLKAFAEAAGFEIEKFRGELVPPGTSAHEMGTARMGADPATSVLNSHNQSWDVGNLFVTDGACFPSSGFQNPTLTMMAITVRASRYIVEQLKRGEL